MDYLGRFELLRRLHGGATADIHLARQWGDGGFHRPAVVKCLHAHLAEDPYALIQFQDEARILAALRHHAFPAVWDLRCVGATWFHAMELVTGWRLDQVLELGAQRTHPLPLAVALGLASQLLDALAHAHGADVVHCKVTSDNVILGVDGTIRLLDLGAAVSPLRRHVAASIHDAVDFMAPEQVSGGAVDARTDVFAVGFVLYRMTTGALPFESEEDLERLTAIVERDAPAPSTVRDDYPAELDAIVQKAIAREPAARYESAAAFARALESFALRDGLLTGPVAVAGYVASALPPLGPFEELEGEPVPPPYVLGETVSPDEVELVESTEIRID